MERCQSLLAVDLVEGIDHVVRRGDDEVSPKPLLSALQLRFGSRSKMIFQRPAENAFICHTSRLF